MTQIKAAPPSQRHRPRYSAAQALIGLAWACATAFGGLPAPATAQPPAQPAARPAPTGQPQVLPTVDLNAGLHRIRAMVARSPQERSTGLMWRTEMAPNDGMLFVFDEPQMQCFWMKNTLIPLAIAFVADDGRIVNLDEMKPQTTNTHCSTQPVRFVLEMNAGWFQRKGIVAGDRLGGAPFRK